MPLFTKSSSLVFTFLRFILFRDKVMFRRSPRSNVQNIQRDFSVKEFWPKLRLVTFAQKHALRIYFTTSSDILFLTSFKFLSLLVFSMYSHNARTFWSPSSAPPKSITSHRSFLRSSNTCLYFSGMSIFFFFLLSTGPRIYRFEYTLKSVTDFCLVLLLLCIIFQFYFKGF